MKILLINPPIRKKYGKKKGKAASIAPPLNLAYLAAMLQHEEYETHIIDANALNMDIPQLGGLISDSKADVVGVTAMTSTLSLALQVLESAKKNNPGVMTVMGGAHPSVCSIDTAKYSCCDAVVYGEGEMTLLELVRAFEQGDPLYKVQGIAYGKDGEIVKTFRRALITDLDGIPYPAYHLLPMDMYRPPAQHMMASRGKHDRPFAIMLSGRGCPYQCIFCSTNSVFGRRARLHSPEYILGEISLLQEQYQIRRINFMDDTFTLDRKRAIRICEMLKDERVSLEWYCTTRVDRVDEEILEKMKEAGCDLIFYGIESGNQEVLDQIKKGTTLNQIRKAVSLTKKLGIGTICNFMLGNPSESSDTINESIHLAKELDPDLAYFSITTLFPGTDLYTRAKAEGQELEINWEDFSEPEFNPSLAYVPTGLAPQILKEAQKRAYKSFYWRIKYILGRLKYLKGFRSIRYIFYGLRAFRELI